MAGLRAPRRNLGVRPIPDPRQLSGCKLWFWANDVAAADGAGISAWRDISGNQGVTSASVTATFRPDTDTKSSLEFNKASSRSLQLATSVSSTSSEWTLMTAVNLTNVTGDGNGHYIFDAQTGRVIFAPLCSTGSFNSVGFFVNGAWQPIAVATTGWQILTWTIGASTGFVYKNGLSLGSGSSATVAINSTPRIGSSYDNTGAFMDMRLGYFALWQRVLSDAERKPMELSLGHYYGIQVS